MILEAFSHVLHREWGREDNSARDILHRWLLSVLTEAEPKDNVSKVIHTEIALLNAPGHAIFLAKSDTGETLLNSLYMYCDSYENWQFGRWLHEIKPHRFNQIR
jgi:hypothetical protein